MRPIQLLDVTLRDVATVNQWRFAEEEILQICSAIDRAGYEYIEAGYFVPSRMVQGEERQGPAVCDAKYLHQVSKRLTATRMAVMVRMSDAPIEALEQLAMAGVSLVRLPIHSREAMQTGTYIQRCQELGMKVSVNLIFLSQRSKEEVISTARTAEELGADIFCIADTISGMLPGDVRSIVSSLSQAVALPIGFHAHDGLRAALVNSIEAIESGAAIVDSSLGGMGSGGSNLMAELVTAYCNKRWNTDFEVSALASVSGVLLQRWIPSNVEASVVAAFIGLLNLNTRECAEAKAEAERIGLTFLDYLDKRLRTYA